MASRLSGRSEAGIRARWTKKIQQTAEARQGASGGSCWISEHICNYYYIIEKELSSISDC